MGIMRTVILLASILLPAVFDVAAGVGVEPRVALVQGTISTPNPQEERYASTATRRLSRWLSEVGVRHSTLSDEQVAGGLRPSVSVVILGYNPHPSDREMAALKRFVERGGRMIVFYSSHAGLAELLYMKLGPYKKSEEWGRWACIRFNRHAPPHVPPAMAQCSHNIRPVYAVSGRSRVIAEWETAKGRPTGTRPGRNPIGAHGCPTFCWTTGTHGTRSGCCWR